MSVAAPVCHNRERPALRRAHRTCSSMSIDGEKGGPSADIPEQAIADALAAVEKSPAAAELPVETELPEPAAPLSETQVLRAELEMSQQRAREVYEKLKAEHDRHLRTAADFDNYKKRALRDREETVRFSNERMVKEFLPVLDALERALAAASKDDPLRGGVELTRKMFEEVLARFGVKGFSAKGQPFDPNQHEALLIVETDEKPAGVVLEEQQRGFFLHDRLIRPAAVVVSKSRPKSVETKSPPEGTSNSGSSNVGSTSTGES